jgi:hyperosmotically inducible periplasmic protein
MTQRNAIAAVAASALLALSGCTMFQDTTASSGQSRSVQQTGTDAAITATVKTALGADSLVKARNIDVDTSRGVVTLNGTVGSAAEKQRALEIARRAEGVSSVKDNLRVGG